MESLTPSAAFSHCWHKNRNLLSPLKLLKACGAVLKAFFGKYTVSIVDPKILENILSVLLTRRLKIL